MAQSLLHDKRFPAENVKSGVAVPRQGRRSGSLGKTGHMLCHRPTEETVWTTVGCRGCLILMQLVGFGLLDV